CYGKSPSPCDKTLSRWEKDKEVAYGWTGEQNCPDYGRWGYERHRSGHGAQASSTGRGHCLDRSTTAARGSATGRGQTAVARHRERGGGSGGAGPALPASVV